MNPTLIFTIAALLISALGGYLLKQYGNSKYDSGHSAGLLECSNTNTAESVKDKADFEKVQNDKKNLTPDALDADLKRMGIMREESDY